MDDSMEYPWTGPDSQSPWGKSLRWEELCPGVFFVSTAISGGIMVSSVQAKQIFSAAALQCAVTYHGCCCFEQDCAVTIAYRELLDRGLITVPEGSDAAEIERDINQCIQEHYPQYWQARERALAGGLTVLPTAETRDDLPEQCYSVLAETGAIIIIKRDETGYYKAGIDMGSKTQNRALADRYNQKLGVSKAQAAAMSAGSMFGWHTPAADPKNYDEQGCLLKMGRRDRGDARWQKAGNAATVYCLQQHRQHAERRSAANHLQGKECTR